MKRLYLLSSNVSFLKQLAMLLIVSAFAVTAGVNCNDVASNEIQVIDDGRPITVKQWGVLLNRP